MTVWTVTGGIAVAFLVIWYLTRQRRGKVNLRVTPEQLLVLQSLVEEGMVRIEEKKKAIIDQAARDGKTVKREAILKYLIETVTSYDGPDREERRRDAQKKIDDFRAKYPEDIRVDEAYRIQLDLERQIEEAEKEESR
jgi:hypothetical protein